ncbi:type II toxin-antitoxin system RelE/ParE family toxin [Candidatus Collierbacteria bacterium]|nr:type II toxin-antitoxin system RelE/ParE family toxin [Candidatus Collierbacteria bacterium]
MDLRYKEQAIKDLKKIGPAERKKAIRKLENLSNYPFAGKRLEGKLAHLRSLRAWPLRILYDFDKDNKIITIYTIDYRGRVYK